MKTAVISDIHGNPHALEKVLEDIESNSCERIVCLGDITGYGYDPDKCATMVRKACAPEDVIIGNHDAAVIGHLGLAWFNSVAAAGIMRSRASVSEDNKKYLEGLTRQKIERKECSVCYTHGFPDSGLEFEYVESPYDASMAFMTLRRLKTPLLFVGHTHYATAWRRKDTGDDWGNMDILDVDDTPISIDPERPLIVNVGSVGYPRSQPHSTYSIYDDSDMTVSWRRLEFDFDGYCRRLQDADIEIPRWMTRWEDEGLVNYQHQGEWYE